MVSLRLWLVSRRGRRGGGSRQGPAGALDLYTWWAIRRALEMGSNVGEFVWENAG